MNELAWEAARQQLIQLLREHAVHYGPTTVEPGVVTDVFIDPSRVTLLGEGPGSFSFRTWGCTAGANE